MNGHDKRKHDPVLILTGPTASGKSDLAIRLALALDGEIISADSMQIYRGFDIGTAKVSPEEQKLVKHHLLDICEAGDRYSVAEFVQDAERLIEDIQACGKTAIICGGTGLYITSLMDGLEFAEEEFKPELRERVRTAVAEMGLEAAHDKMRALDPEAAERIHCNDEKRIVRFFEIYEAHGLTRSDSDRKSREKGPSFIFRAYALMPERQGLYKRINERCRKMFDRGLTEEAQHFMEAYGDRAAQTFQAIGYKEIIPYLEGRISREEACEALSQATRRYAKRQLSLFRSRKDITPIFTEDPEERFQFIRQDFEKTVKNLDF